MAAPPPPPPYPQRPSRPIGVAILAILIILVGVILVLVSLLFVLAALVVLAATGSVIILLIASVFFILSLLLLLAGIGLWKLRPWAWWLSIIVLILVIINRFAGVTLSDVRTLSTVDLIIVGFPILILIYLLAVRHHFRSPTPYVPPR